MKNSLPPLPLIWMLSLFILGSVGCHQSKAPLQETNYFTIDRNIRKPKTTQSVHMALGQPQSSQIGFPPPEPLTEQADFKPPYPGWIWIDGYWHWNSVEWVWINGEWIPPRGSLVYVEPSYIQETNFVTYTSGYWDHSYNVYNNPGFDPIYPVYDRPLSKRRPRPRRVRPRRPIKRPTRHISKVTPRAIGPIIPRPDRPTARPPRKPIPIESRLPPGQSNSFRNPADIPSRPRPRPTLRTPQIGSVQSDNRPHRQVQPIQPRPPSSKPKMPGTKLPGIKLPTRIRRHRVSNTISPRGQHHPRPSKFQSVRVPTSHNRPQPKPSRNSASAATPRQPRSFRVYKRPAERSQSYTSQRTQRPQNRSVSTRSSNGFSNRRSVAPRSTRQRPAPTRQTTRRTTPAVRTTRSVSPRIQSSKPRIQRRSPRSRPSRSSSVER